MPHNVEIAQAPDRLREGSLSTTDVALDVAPPAADAPARVDETGVELKRGAFLNTIAMLASNFRGIFTFLVARLLGPASRRIAHRLRAFDKRRDQICDAEHNDVPDGCRCAR